MKLLCEFYIGRLTIKAVDIMVSLQTVCQISHHI